MSEDLHESSNDLVTPWLGYEPTSRLDPVIWLTDDLKAKHLRDLVEAERANRLDDGAMSALSQINAIDGIVTTGCCIGHDDEPDPGYISIRTDRDMDRLFEDRVIPSLLDQPFIDHITKAYERDENRNMWARLVFAFYPGCIDKLAAHVVALVSGEPLCRKRTKR